VKSSVPIILAAVVLGAGLMFCVGKLMPNGNDSPPPAGNQSGANNASTPKLPTGSAADSSSIKLVQGKRYRMMIVSARLPAKKLTGKPWDMNAGLPDCFFMLRTPENQYKSQKVSDCLIPNWSDKSLSVSDLWSGRVRVANEGAVFVYDPAANKPITLNFIDSDVARNDTIVNLVFSMNLLQPGYTEYRASCATRSISINSDEQTDAPEMLFTIRIIPDGI
jgi:hypothetical protein